MRPNYSAISVEGPLWSLQLPPHMPRCQKQKWHASPSKNGQFGRSSSHNNAKEKTKSGHTVSPQPWLNHCHQFMRVNPKQVGFKGHGRVLSSNNIAIPPHLTWAFVQTKSSSSDRAFHYWPLISSVWLECRGLMAHWSRGSGVRRLWPHHEKMTPTTQYRGQLFLLADKLHLVLDKSTRINDNSSWP